MFFGDGYLQCPSFIFPFSSTCYSSIWSLIFTQNDIVTEAFKNLFLKRRVKILCCWKQTPSAELESIFTVYNLGVVLLLIVQKHIPIFKNCGCFLTFKYWSGVSFRNIFIISVQLYFLQFEFHPYSLFCRESVYVMVVSGGSKALVFMSVNALTNETNLFQQISAVLIIKHFLFSSLLKGLSNWVSKHDSRYVCSYFIFRMFFNKDLGRMWVVFQDFSSFFAFKLIFEKLFLIFFSIYLP